VANDKEEQVRVFNNMGADRRNGQVAVCGDSKKKKQSKSKLEVAPQEETK
jgi:hypothetical protein